MLSQLADTYRALTCHRSRVTGPNWRLADKRLIGEQDHTSGQKHTCEALSRAQISLKRGTIEMCSDSPASLVRRLRPFTCGSVLPSPPPIGQARLLEFRSSVGLVLFQEEEASGAKDAPVRASDDFSFLERNKFAPARAQHKGRRWSSRMDDSLR